MLSGKKDISQSEPKKFSPHNQRSDQTIAVIIPIIVPSTEENGAQFRILRKTHLTLKKPKNSSMFMFRNDQIIYKSDLIKLN